MLWNVIPHFIDILIFDAFGEFLLHSDRMLIHGKKRCSERGNRRQNWLVMHTVFGMSFSRIVCFYA
jgi:hypothetical protein